MIDYYISLNAGVFGLGANPDVPLLRDVVADFSEMTFNVRNQNSKPVNEVAGTIKISGADYNYFFDYINDTANYYFDHDRWQYDLFRNGVEIDTQKIELVDNDIENSVATYKLTGEIGSEYSTIYYNIDNKENIIANVTVATNEVSYTDFRSFVTYNNVAQGTQAISTQESLNGYINGLINADSERQPYSIFFDNIGANSYNVFVDYEQLWAYGNYLGSERVPPPGVDWIYDTDVLTGGITYPKYIKKFTFVNVSTYPTHNPGGDMTASINNEDINDIIYDSASRSVEDVIEYLVTEADSSVQFDGDSFSSFDTFIGETFGAYVNATKVFKYLQLIHISDFISNAEGAQNNVLATKGLMSLRVILEWFEQIGFVWYLEDIAGTKYFRLQHFSDKTLTSGNPDLTDYFDQDWTPQTNDFTYAAREFDIINNNSQSSRYEFNVQTFNYFDGGNAKVLGDPKIITDVDFVIDAKDAAFNSTDQDVWVLVALCPDDISDDWLVRAPTNPFTVSNLATNNTELSFLYSCYSYVIYPSRNASVLVGGGLKDADFTSRRNEITLEGIPIEKENTIFTQFDIDLYIEYGIDEAEIAGIDQKAEETVCTLKIKYR